MSKYLILIFGILFFISCANQSSENKLEKYQPTLQSIRAHDCPQWFKDAKFGMFIDWGIYSVPGWAPMKEEGPCIPIGICTICMFTKNGETITGKPGVQISKGMISSQCSSRKIFSLIV